MLDPLDISLIITTLVAGFIGAGVFPLIIKLSYKHKFFKSSNSRTVHGKYVSTLGGIGIFLGLITGLSAASFINQDLTLMTKLFGLIFPLMIVFILGTWDDLHNLRAHEKLMLQGLAAVTLLTFHPIAVTDFGGFLGIHEIPLLLGYSLSFLVIMTLINAVNLLDGIDGFAGLYVVLLSIFMAVTGYLMQVHYLQIIGLASVGVLTPFLYYNMFYRRKLFMGDSGSLVLGLLTAFYVLSFIKEVRVQSDVFSHPLNWAYALVALPLIDLMRVIFIRLRARRPLFSGDKNHIHHAYLNMGLTHNQTTFIVMQLTLSLWLFVNWLEFLNPFWHFVATWFLIFALYVGPIFIYRKTGKFKFS